MFATRLVAVKLATINEFDPIFTVRGETKPVPVTDIVLGDASRS